MQTFPLTSPTLSSTTQDSSEMAAAIRRHTGADAEVEIVDDAPAPETPAVAPPVEETPAVPPVEAAPAAEAVPVVATEEDDPDEDEVTTEARVREALPPKVQARVDRLSRARYKAKEEAATERAKNELLTQQVEELRKDIAGRKPAETTAPEPVAVAPVVEAPDPEPQESDFNDDPNAWAYPNAHAAWVVRQAVKAATAASDLKIAALETKLAAADTTRQQEQIQNDIWLQRREQAEAVEPDIREVMTSKLAYETPVTPIMNQYLHEETEIGPRIALYLVKHQEENRAIVEATTLPDKATPAQIQKALQAVARHIGRIEDKILATAAVAAPGPPSAVAPAEPSAPAAVTHPAPAPAAVAPIPATPKKSAVSNAPPPISPVGTGGTAPTVDPGKMNGTDYNKWRAADLAAKRAN